MASYMAAVTVSIVAVLGLFLALELTSPKPILALSLSSTPADELIEIAENRQSENQIAAIHQLAKLPKSLDSTVPVLARLATSRNPRVMSAARSSLKEIGEPAVEILKPFFEAKTKSGTLLGCSAVEAIGDPCKTYLPELKELLNNGDKVDRHSALYALKGIGVSGAELLDDVIVSLSDEDFNVRLMACRVLEAFGPKAAKAESELLRLLNKGTPSVRGRAAISLAAIGPALETEDVVDLIAKRLDGDGRMPITPVEYQRHLAALATFGTKSKKHVEKIRERLTHQSVGIQVSSAVTIYKITGETEEPTKVVEELVKNEFRAGQAIDLLGQYGEEAAPFVPAIQSCLDSADPINRETAIVALMQIGTDDLEIIKRIHQMVDDEDTDVQLAAKEAIELLKVLGKK